MGISTDFAKIALFFLLVGFPSAIGEWFKKEPEESSATLAVSQPSVESRPQHVLEERLFLYQSYDGVSSVPEHPILVDMFVMVFMSKTEQSMEYMLPMFIFWLSYQTKVSAERDRIFAELLLVSLELELSIQELEAKITSLEILVQKQEHMLRRCCSHDFEVTKQLLEFVRLQSMPSISESSYKRSSSMIVYKKQSDRDSMRFVPSNKSWMKLPVVWLGLMIITLGYFWFKLTPWWLVTLSLVLIGFNCINCDRVTRGRILRAFLSTFLYLLRFTIKLAFALLKITWKVGRWISMSSI